jgi:hypothetical protein
MSLWPAFETKELPEPPKLRSALGVGLIVMGMAMGTGELILWPHLVAKHGLGILWLALVGITFQYFINQEVARHSLATGEGFFTSSARIIFWSPIFWLLASVLLYIWPGWSSALGTILATLFGFGNYVVWAWLSLALVLFLTFKGQVAYVMLERSLKVTVPLFLVLLIIISVSNLSTYDLLATWQGLTNFGYIPKGIDLQVLLGAIVFSGAGGMLNLCVSLWYRDKKAGMGYYAGRISNPITGRPEAVSVTGYRFEESTENLKRWRGWMRYLRIDQGIIFWLLGVVALVLLSVNAYVVLSPLGIVPSGAEVAVAQAKIFSSQWGIVGEKIYLIMAYLMLFSVMWTVLDALVRIISDIIHTNSRAGRLEPYFRWLNKISIHHLYYGLIVFFVLLQALLLPFDQPLGFLVISSVLGGLTMAIYTPILIYLNNFKLPKSLRPGFITTIMMILAFSFYIYFVWEIVKIKFGI